MANRPADLRSHLERHDPDYLERMDATDADFDKGAANRYTRDMNRLLTTEGTDHFVRFPHETDAPGIDIDIDDVDVVVHMGCHVLETPHIATGTLDLIEAMGFTPVPVGGFANCCGVQDLKNGDLSAVEATDANRFATIAAFEPDYMVTECTSCFAVTDHLSLGYREPDFSVRSLPAFLAEHARRLPTPTVERPVTVAIHDHYDGRGWTPPEEPANVRSGLSEIPGIEVAEMDHSMADGLPCSFMSDPEAHGGINLDRTVFEEAAAAGADVLLTFWHACHRTLAPYEAEFEVATQNIAPFLMERFGRDYRDAYKEYAILGVNGTVEDILEAARPTFEATGLSEERARALIEHTFIRDDPIETPC